MPNDPLTPELVAEMTDHALSEAGCSSEDAWNYIEALAADWHRLRRGEFTEEEFQNLCHHLSEDPENACKFADGCDAYQKKLFGSSRSFRYYLRWEKLYHENERLHAENVALQAKLDTWIEPSQETDHAEGQQRVVSQPGAAIHCEMTPIPPAVQAKIAEALRGD